MRANYSLKFLVTAVLLIILTGCATFKQGGEVKYDKVPAKNTDDKKANILFVFSHTKQQTGYDAIPKQITPQFAVVAFNDIFRDALREISNIGNYTIFSQLASDVENPKRRQEKEELAAKSNFVIDIGIQKTSSYARDFIGTMVSIVTLTLIPVSIPAEYTATVNVYDSKGKLIKTYTQKAQLDTWVHLFMVYYYPTHSPEKGTEDVYIDLLHNIFRQIETDKILTVS
jgi:hypothetical protein